VRRLQSLIMEEAHCGFHSFTGKRTVKHTLGSESDDKIQAFEDKFEELKKAFQIRAVLETEITVSRILGVVETLSKRVSIHLDLST
jgi:hypothetical protein